MEEQISSNNITAFMEVQKERLNQVTLVLATISADIKEIKQEQNKVAYSSHDNSKAIESLIRGVSELKGSIAEVDKKHTERANLQEKSIDALKQWKYAGTIIIGIVIFIVSFFKEQLINFF